MNLKLKNKRALVAASSKGLGKAIAESLASEGVNLILCARGKSVLEKTVNEIKEKYHVDVKGIQVDLNIKTDIDKLIGLTIENYNGIDILVNNAGGPKPGDFFSIEEKDWWKYLELHFFSALRLIKGFIPKMIDQEWGRIINVVSRAVKEPRPNNILSSAIRLPILAMSRSLATNVGPNNITINSVCPGPFKTERLKNLCQQKANKDNNSIEDYYLKYAQSVLLKRLGDPSEIGDIVSFLASEKASFLTGQVIMVDGGSVKTLF